MKTAVCATLTALALAPAVPAAATEVGISVQISQPGVYGRIDIGRFPQPQVVVATPVIVARPPMVQPPPPVYMWVPPGHRKNWRKHCADYNACGVPVYFVRHDWYDQQVRRDDRGRGRDRDEGRGKGHGKGKGKGKNDD